MADRPPVSDYGINVVLSLLSAVGVAIGWGLGAGTFAFAVTVMLAQIVEAVERAR
jgi:hypothetical protein